MVGVSRCDWVGRAPLEEGVGFVPFEEVGGKVVVVVGAGVGESCGSGVKGGKLDGGPYGRC